MAGLEKKKIDGKTYEHYQGFKKKAEAETFAAKIKKQGAKSVKVILHNGWYGVWVYPVT